MLPPRRSILKGSPAPAPPAGALADLQFLQHIDPTVLCEATVRFARGAQFAQVVEFETAPAVFSENHRTEWAVKGILKTHNLKGSRGSGQAEERASQEGGNGGDDTEPRSTRVIRFRDTVHIGWTWSRGKHCREAYDKKPSAQGRAEMREELETDALPFTAEDARLQENTMANASEAERQAYYRTLYATQAEEEDMSSSEEEEWSSEDDEEFEDEGKEGLKSEEGRAMAFMRARRHGPGGSPPAVHDHANHELLQGEALYAPLGDELLALHERGETRNIDVEGFAWGDDESEEGEGDKVLQTNAENPQAERAKGNIEAEGVRGVESGNLMEEEEEEEEEEEHDSEDDIVDYDSEEEEEKWDAIQKAVAIAIDGRSAQHRRFGRILTPVTECAVEMSEEENTSKPEAPVAVATGPSGLFSTADIPGNDEINDSLRHSCPYTHLHS